jgi:hypothetical protein
LGIDVMVRKSRILKTLNMFLLVLAGVVGSAEADDADPGKLVRLEVSGGHEQLAIIGNSDRIQLVVTAHFGAGQVRDWTHRGLISVEPAGIIEVDSTGLVTPLSDGEVTIKAASDSQQSSLKLTVKQFNDPPAVSFPNRITPIFTKHGCNGGGCHGKSGGQNGFQLSLLGFEPQEDYVYLVKEARGRRVFPAAPERSLLLQKAAGVLPHGGGVRIDKESDEYRMLRLWIEQGMPYGNDDDPVLERISVFPEERTLNKDSSQQLTITAHYSDGSTRNVTRQAQYEANNTDLADSSAAGNVRLLGVPGVVAVMVRYQGQVAAFRATVPLGAPVDKLPPVRNFIDELVFAQLKVLGLPPSDVCDDSTFLRRVTIDIVGRIPTYEETVQFLDDTDPNKRSKAIDRLLDTQDYADYFAQKWGAILRNNVQQNVPRDGNYRFHDWVRSNLLRNTSYDQFVRSVITASGDYAYNPAVNWHRHVKDVNEKVEDTAQVFLGLRIQCARCHHHPFEKWSQNDYWALAAFYSNVREKNNRYVYAQRQVAQTRHPKTNEALYPTGLGSEALELTADDDARLALADWLTAPENPFFAKALTNRYWKHFFGIGIVDPEDDMRATNPPSNPELLDALAKNFVESKFDLKQLIRTICNSTTYQLSALPNEFNAADQQSNSRFQPRRVNAEVLLDSIDQLMGTSSSFANLPSGSKATQIPDFGGANNLFLNTFGRPAGASACECERTGDISMSQSLQLLNSTDIYTKLSQSRARTLVADQDKSDEDRLAELYLRAFSRRPTDAEIEIYLQYIAKYEEKDKLKAYEDILWTLINTKEFMFNH